MPKWAGTRDYNEWLEYARKYSTKELLKHVTCNLYCILCIYEARPIEERFNWISVWNSYIELKTNFDVLTERGIDRYPTKITAEAMLARLKNALDNRRVEGRESRISRRLARAQMRIA